MTNDAAPIHRHDWLLLIFLSILWGGSFFFTGAALRELPPLTIVFIRVTLGATFLLPVVRALGGSIPGTLAGWWPFAVMGLLNNVIPFSLFVAAQTQISSGLASVLNATTPLFTVLVLAGFGDERLNARRIAGLLLGILGVAVLAGAASLPAGLGTGMALCLAGAVSYGFSGLWGRRKLAGVPPITSATCQLVCSSAMMLLVAGATEQPWRLPVPSLAICLSLLALAALSTALAYIVFFQILVRSGAANVMLVTLLIPVTAILLGYFVLGEPLTAREIAGALVIGSALVVIDGRALRWPWS